MKLLIASDIHGAAKWCGKLMDEIDSQQPDKVILLGDLLYHGPRNNGGFGSLCDKGLA